MPLITKDICPVVTEDTLSRLKKENLDKVSEFISTDPEIISQKSKIAFKDVVVIRRVLLAKYSSFLINSADLYDEVVSSVSILSTGCDNIDHLLDGGLYSSEVTEVVGPAGSGRTQLCLTCAGTVAMDTKQTVLFIDTGSSFEVSRLLEVLQERGLSETEIESTCSLIKCCKAFDVFELLNVLDGVKDHLNDQSDEFYSNLKLVIVDCVASVLSPNLGGVKIDGHGYMMYVARTLKSLAVEYSIAVLMTNNVVISGETEVKPALGKSWLPVPNCRLEMRTSIGGQRCVTICKSTRQSVPSATECKITDTGIESVLM